MKRLFLIKIAYIFPFCQKNDDDKKNVGEKKLKRNNDRQTFYPSFQLKDKYNNQNS